MARINLLPWREKRRKDLQRQFAVMAVGSAIFSAFVVLYVHIHISGLITVQNNRNTYLKDEIKIVEKDIEEIKNLENDKSNLLARMRIIQKLQSARPEIVHLFYEAAATLPEGVYLNKVARKGELLEIEGVAESNSNVSAYMRTLDESSWLTSPALDVIDSSKKDYAGLAWFTLRVNQTRPKTEDGSAPGGSAGATPVAASNAGAAGAAATKTVMP